MDILAFLKAIVGAITAAFLALSGHSAAPQTAVIAEVASTTDSIVQSLPEPTPEAKTTTIKDAYELGKSVGRLEVIVLPAKSTTTMEQTPTQPPTTSAPQTTVTPTAPAPAAAPEPVPQAAPVSQARIEIVNPIPGQGSNREFTANDYQTYPDGSLQPGSTEPTIDNSMDIGAVVYDDAGKALTAVVVTITATDTNQNKELHGTGNVWNTYVDGQRVQLPVYSFHYDFRTQGDHTITFTSGNLFKSITVNVAK